MAVYDSFAHLYHKSRQQSENDPWMQILKYTFFNVLGDVADKSILDLACGTGVFTRMFKPAAKLVIGVDISEKMIEIARQEEAREPLGIEYLVGDVLELGEIDQFDIVVAAFLLNYSQTKEQLLKMCQNIYVNLKPNGRFVTVNANVELPAEVDPKLEKYSSLKGKVISGPLQEGTPITITVDLDGEQFSFDNYCLSKATYNWAFQEAGFKKIHWHKQMISPQSIKQFGEEFWQDALDYPMNVYIECVK